MQRRAFLASALFPALARAQDAVEFVCPMDKDVRQPGPGSCPRCGMKLVPALATPVEYGLRVTPTPRRFRAGEPVELAFEVLDPKSGARVQDFEIVHERLFHLFLLSSDLTWFAHEHPVRGSDGLFRLRTQLPPAAIRLLCDFYPHGGTPQLIPHTLFTPGSAWRDAQLASDPGPCQCENLRVELTVEPATPLAGFQTRLFFGLDTDEGLQPYLGAWGHLLAASSDTLDLIHTHPAFPEPGRRIQFNVLFPRPGMHRIWVQFQRRGVVNTAAFNVPVAKL